MVDAEEFEIPSPVRHKDPNPLQRSLVPLLQQEKHEERINCFLFRLTEALSGLQALHNE
jgi:hypothetical protein